MIELEFELNKIKAMDTVDIVNTVNSMNKNGVHLDDYAKRLRTEYARRKLTSTYNITGLYDKHDKQIKVGDILCDDNGNFIVIDDFGRYIPATFTYRPQGSMDVNKHKPLYTLAVDVHLPNYKIIMRKSKKE